MLVAGNSSRQNSCRSRMDRLRLCSFRASRGRLSGLPSSQYSVIYADSRAALGCCWWKPSKSTLFTDSRYTFQAREEVTGARIHIAKKGLLRAVGEALQARRGRMRVAYSAGHLTVAQKDALADGWRASESAG